MSKGMFAALFAGSLIGWTISNGLVPLLPIYAVDLGATEALAGYYLAICMGGVILGAFVAGWLSDRYGHRKLMLIITTAVNTPLLWLIGRVTNTSQLILLTFIWWFSGGIGVALISILAGLFTDKKQRGRVFGLIALSNGLGAVLGNASFGAIHDQWGYPVLFSALALFNVICPLLVIFFMEDKPVVRQQEAGQRMFRTPLGSGFYLLLAASVCVTTGGFAGGLCVSLDMNSLKFPQADIGGVNAIGTLVALPFAFLLGWLSDRFNRKALLNIGYLLGAIGLAVGSVSTSFSHFATVISLSSIRTNASGSVGPALAVDLLPPAALGIGLGAFNALPWIGGVLGNGLAGIAVKSFGAPAVFLASAALTLLGIALIIPARRRQSVPETAMQAS